MGSGRITTSLGDRHSNDTRRLGSSGHVIQRTEEVDLWKGEGSHFQGWTDVRGRKRIWTPFQGHLLVLSLAQLSLASTGCSSSLLRPAWAASAPHGRQKVPLGETSVRRTTTGGGSGMALSRVQMFSRKMSTGAPWRPHSHHCQGCCHP